MHALDAKAHAHIVLLAQTFYIQPLVCDSGVYVKCKSMCHISGGQHTWQSLEQYATPLRTAAPYGLFVDLTLRSTNQPPVRYPSAMAHTRRTGGRRGSIRPVFVIFAALWVVPSQQFLVPLGTSAIRRYARGVMVVVCFAL